MSTDILRAAFFCGMQKEEVLVVGGKTQAVPPGSLLKYILETDEQFWIDLTKLADSILTVCTRARLPDSEVETSAAYAAEVIEAVQITKGIMDLSAPSLLKELMIFLPAHAGYAEAIRKDEQVNLSKLELAEFKHELYRNDKNPHDKEPTIARFYERRREAGNYPAISSRWSRWLHDLVDDDALDELPDELDTWKDRSGMLEVIKQYCFNLRSACIEAKKLKRSIAVAFGIDGCAYEAVSRTDAMDELIRCIEPPALLGEKDTCAIFADNTLKDKDRAYAATTLSALISLEIQLCRQYHLELRRCEFCGGYFATRNTKSKYCKYPNPDYEDKPCQKIAPQMTYWSSSVLMQEYRKSYTNYRRWVNRTTTRDEGKMYDYILELQKFVAYTFGKRKGHLVMKKIEREINSVFSQWDKNAKEMLEGFKAGTITEEACRAALALPSIKDRSALLASWDGNTIDIDETDIR